jgi:hypothetical protein
VRYSIISVVSPFSPFLFIFGVLIGLCENEDPNFRPTYGAASGENHMACDRPKFIHGVAIRPD